MSFQILAFSVDIVQGDVKTIDSARIVIIHLALITEHKISRTARPLTNIILSAKKFRYFTTLTRFNEVE